MDARRAYEQDVLSTFAGLAGARQPGMSDQDHHNEHRAQSIFYAALERFRADVANAAPFTDLRRDALDDLLGLLNDAAPDRAAWDEAINSKLRGWK